MYLEIVLALLGKRSVGTPLNSCENLSIPAVPAAFGRYCVQPSHSPPPRRPVYILLRCCKLPAMPNPKDKTRGRVRQPSLSHPRVSQIKPAPWFLLGLLAAASLLPPSMHAKTKANPASSTGTSFELKATLADATQAVGEVAADPILYGTYVYEHDKTLIGAQEQDDSSAFGNDKPAGKTFYKVIDGVIAPRHFKDTEDSGAITVRYVVRELTPTTVNLRIDAVFITHKIAHASQGAVETAEFGQVQQHLDRIQARAREAEEERKVEALAATTPSSSKPAAPAVVEYQAPEEPTEAQDAAASEKAPPPSTAPSAAPLSPAPADSVAELEQRVARLRHQAEAVVKASGAELRSAPFHTAKAIETVPAKSEVAIVILTNYWYGVQTTAGHTGWILRSELEPLP